MHAELLLLAGLGLGFANVLASSGSAISLPILLSLGLAPELANGTNRVAVLIGTGAAFISFARAGRIHWPVVRPLIAVAVAGALLGVWISEIISPMRMHTAIIIAECIALALLVIRPARWVHATESNPHVGPKQLALVFAIGVWTGFIILDGGTYLLIFLVLSVGFNLVSANATKVAILASISAATLPVLATGGHVDWGAAAVLSIGALTGALIAARLALHPSAARWIYRLIVVILIGELAHLAYAGLWM